VSGRRTALALALALLAAAASGCVTLGRSGRGTPIPPETVALLEVGRTTRAQALERLGAPVAVERHPDALVLIYAASENRYFRLGIDPGVAFRLVPVNPVAEAGISNLRFTYQRSADVRTRLVLLFDPRTDQLAGVGYQDDVGHASYF
jgi:hypothetical protein